MRYYVGDTVKITYQGALYSDHVGEITGIEVKNYNGRGKHKYRIRLKNNEGESFSVYYPHKYLELVESKVDESLLEWMSRKEVKK